MTRAWLVVLVLGPVFLAAGPVRSDEGGPYDRYLPGTEPDNVRVVRVLAFQDGRPVPVEGARVSGWSEEHLPTPVVTSRLLAEGTTDEHGFATVAWPEGTAWPFHWLVHAKGHAVCVLEGSGSGAVVLQPGVPYPLRVLAPMGEPLAGARVEYYIYGCPHSPTAVLGTTDEDGRLVLDDLPLSSEVDDWGQLWIVAEGVEPGPYGVPPRRFDGTTPELLTRPGRTVEGVVVDEAGQPMAGVAVRELGYPRGPATTTDEEGRFRLFGLSVPEFGLYVPGDLLEGGYPNAVVKDFASDVPVRIPVRRGQPNLLGAGEPRHVVDVEVHQRYSPEAPPSPERGVPVRLVRLADGLLVAGETGDPAYGLWRTTVPPGRYRVRVGGGFSTVVAAEREIDVPTEEAVRFVLDATPTLFVRGVDSIDPPGAELRVAGHVTEAIGSPGHPPHLPADVPAIVRLEGEGPVFFPVGPVQDGFRLATVAPVEPAVVRCRVRSADPERSFRFAEAMWTDTRDDPFGEEGDDETEDRLVTWGRGPRTLCVRAPDFQEVTRTVTIGPDDREIDLGEILLHPLVETRVVVRHADGTPPRDLDLRWGEEGQYGNELQEDDGSFLLELGPAPDPALLLGPGLYPAPLRLSSKGPFEVRLPPGCLDVRVRDEAGQALDAVVYVDGVRVTGDGGLHVLRGIPPGRHTVLAGARGHLGAVRVVDVSAEPGPPVELVLPPR